MSVDLERLIIDAGVEPRDFVTTPKWTGSVWWQAEQIRALTMMVGFDPTDDNPFHGQVWGAFTTAQRRSLQASAAWFVALPGIAISSE